VIIDVDTHWEAVTYASGEHPLAPWIDDLPSGVDMLAFGVAGDLLRALPEAERPTAHELLPALVRKAETSGGPVVLHPLHESTATERVAWMDRIGIDHCLVNPGGYWQQVQFVRRADWPRAIERCNAFLGEQLSATDRLHPVALADLSDPMLAVAQLEHARAAGARAFFLSTENGRPPGGRSPGHPELDPVWDAAVRLGMLAVIHVGNTEADFGGWADIGWPDERSAGIGGLVRLANTQRVHAAQNLVAGMLYGGVFARHPHLTVMLEEMRVNWVPPFFATLERQALPSPALGEWPYDVPGGDMLRHNVRSTPLPGFGDVDALDVLTELPDQLVWSSDYPHFEGNAEPIELYGSPLDELDLELRAWFMGGNVEQCFSRTGDPLPSPRTS
jgi:predicted TIM-barrel fold metal-dependent hydrolase